LSIIAIFDYHARMSIKAERGGALRMPGPPLGNSDPAVEAWALMVRLFLSNKPRMAAIAQEFELAPMQVQTLMALAPGQELPMSALAGMLACDASNITGIVDRLETRGLIERRESPNDRRVKMLAVTSEGARFRARLGKRMAKPPAPVAGLSQADQENLRDILRRALED
jgi:MarR family transcriptional regulator, organic hydroperoxide resistance regulator